MTKPLLGFDRIGSGEPLVLLHGFGSTRDDFTALIPLLAEHFDVISIDLPGHGSSPMIDPPPTVAALAGSVAADLDAHGVDRVHLLGNSLGGRVAVELAVMGRARSVVAISPSGLGLPLERTYQAALMIMARSVNRARRPWLDDMAANMPGRALLLAGMRAMPWLATSAEALTVKGGFAQQRGFWPALLYAILLDVPSGLRKIDCPVIVAQGVLDVIGSGQTPRFTPLIPGARFRILPIAGHAPQSDTPQSIIDLMHKVAFHEAGTRAVAA